MRRGLLYLPLGLWLCLGWASGCGPGAGMGADAPVGAPGETTDELAVTTPARWVYHPREAPSPTAVLALGDGRCVVATEEGERWLIRAVASGGDRCAGESIGSAVAAPEPLRRVVRDRERLRFVGESGTLYEAHEPLGPFDRVIVPPQPLGRVATHGEVTIGLSSAGDPYVLEGDGWVRGDAGGSRLFDVEVDAAGRALAIAWPERVLASTDRGKTFRPVTPSPSVGALAIRAAADGTLGVAGVRGHLAWTAAGTLVPGPARNDARADAPLAELEPVALSPTAVAVAQGRAALAGHRWYELRLASELPEQHARGAGSSARRGESSEAAGWALVRGRLGGALEVVPVAGIPDDHEVRLAAHGRTVALAFIGDDDDDDEGARGPRLVVRRSTDEGRTFVEVARLLAPDVRQVRLAVAPGGDVLVTGACAPPSTAAPAASQDGRDEDEDEAPCRPRAPLLVRPGAAPPRTTTSIAGVATELRGAPASPAFSPDGAIAYFVGRRSKGQQPSIFVSDDGARTWSARPLGRRAEDDDDDGRDRESWEDAPDRHGGALEVLPELPLTVDAEGTLGFAVQTPSAQAWVVADVDGEVRSIAEVPSASGIVAGFGRRALVVEQSGEEVDTWETVDGGSTWTDAGHLRARIAGDLAIACSPAGCAVGDGLTRLGWEAREEPATSTSPRLATRAPNVRTALVCDLDAKGWLGIADVELSAPFPTVDEIARGRAAWSVLSVDRARGVPTVHHVPLEGEGAGRIAARALLDPAARDRPSALRLSHQGEGYAVARKVDGARDLDVGWANFFDGVFGKRAAPVPAGAAVRTTPERVLEMGLLSVAAGGIFVQPVAGRETSFLDARGGSTRADLPDWSKSGVVGRARDDAARVGGRTVFVGLIDAGPTVGLLGVRGDGGDIVVEATTLAPPAALGATSMTSWTYAGPSPGFLVVAADTAGDGWATAVWRRFGEDGKLGSPVAVPTLLDLPERPRPCRAEELKTTPRTESHLVANGRGGVMARGQRHPVIIPGAGEGATPDGALHLLTAGAVLHGTPSAPCLAGWEVTGIDGRRAGAVILGDLSRAWVFRLATPASGAPRRPGGTGPQGVVDVEVRPMTCRWDPGAAVSEGVWDEVGVR